MNNHPGRWQAVATVVLACVLVYLLVDSRTKAVRGCERGRVDRSIIRDIAATAEVARRAAAAESPVGRSANLRAADRYFIDVTDVSTRIDPPFACQKAFPKVNVFGIRLGPSVKPSPVRELPPEWQALHPFAG